MASARPANASNDARLILLARALLFSSERKKLVYESIAEAMPLGLSATGLAAFVSRKLRVSEPTARRAVKRLKKLGLICSRSGAHVAFTRVGAVVFGGVLNEFKE